MTARKRIRINYGCDLLNFITNRAGLLLFILIRRSTRQLVDCSHQSTNSLYNCLRVALRAGLLLITSALIYPFWEP